MVKANLSPVEYRGTRSRANILSKVKNTVYRSRMIAHNTVEYWTADDERVIRLHDTDILVFKPISGIFFVFTGGWTRPLTKDRINRFAPIHIYQHKKVWYVGDQEFYEGMAFNNKGRHITMSSADDGPRRRYLIYDE